MSPDTSESDTFTQSSSVGFEIVASACRVRLTEGSAGTAGLAAAAGLAAPLPALLATLERLALALEPVAAVGPPSTAAAAVVMISRYEASHGSERPSERTETSRSPSPFATMTASLRAMAAGVVDPGAMPWRAAAAAAGCESSRKATKSAWTSGARIVTRRTRSVSSSVMPPASRMPTCDVSSPCASLREDSEATTPMTSERRPSAASVCTETGTPRSAASSAGTAGTLPRGRPANLLASTRDFGGAGAGTSKLMLSIVPLPDLSSATSEPGARFASQSESAMPMLWRPLTRATRSYLRQGCVGRRVGGQKAYFLYLFQA